MEYNSDSKPNLGKSTGIEGVYISSLNSNTYNSENKKSVDVVFQPNGDSYNILVDNDIGYDISNQDTSSNLSSQQERDPEKKYDMFNIGENSINQFFIGSITVIGLFMLYRILQKNK